MKIATFNINNVNRRLASLLEWLTRAAPDVVCLQELKAADAEFPAKALRERGYEAVWRGQRTWNGVAILARSHRFGTTRWRCRRGLAFRAHSSPPSRTAKRVLVPGNGAGP